jgi:hypothetical protein
LRTCGKVRPLGITTLTARAMQALYLLGVDPIEDLPGRATMVSEG